MSDSEITCYIAFIYSIYTHYLVSVSFVRVLEPVCGPNVSVLVHEARRIQIQWDELPVDKQKGFITNYTIYLQMLDFSNTQLSSEQLHRVPLCGIVFFM